MKQLGLTTWERIALRNIVPPASRTGTELRLNLRLLDILDLTETEKREINWRREGDRFTWDRAEFEWPLNFEDADYDHLMKLAKQPQNWPTQTETEMLLIKLKVIEPR